MEMGDGTYLASQKLALKRIREYIEYAERGDGGGLQDAIERHTLDTDAHPNAVIYEACRLIVGMTRAQGRSVIPRIDELVAEFSKPSKGAASRSGLVLP